MPSRRLYAFALIVSLAMVGPLWAQLAPDAEIRDLQPSPDIEVSLFASEPMITNPAAIDIDTHGRVWVAEIQWYRKAAKDPPADKIKVLEDTDGDGKADRVTVFAEGVFAPMSICVAGSKVYVATSPDLWVYEDNDGDLKADGPPTKLLTGFGTRNHDHTAHSLVLGPDHKWWMAHGDTGVDVTGTDGSHIKYKWGTMLRGELDGSQLEIVAENFRNPYEICVDSFGNAFCSDNDNDGNFSARVCWIMDGGDYGWFGGPPGPRGSVPASIPFSEHWHFRGHIPGYVPATLVTGFGSPCGMCFYEGDAFPCLKNMPLHTDPGPREVRAYPHTKSGYGFKATSRTFLTSKDDKYFRPDDICTAPDGTLFVSDWYDGGVGGHAYNNPEQGRIFQLTPKAKKPTRVGKPGPYDNDVDALQGLRSPNLATQFLARERLLASGKNAVPELKKLLVDAEPNVRARSLWVLARIFDSANEPCTEVHEQLKSPDPSMRALAVRILHRQSESHGIVGLRLNVCHPDIKVILSMANDPDPEVRREVLLAMPKIPSVEKPDVLAKLAAQYDGNDRYLLEAINIAAGKGQAPAFAESVYNELVKTNALNDKNLALVQILKPSAAIDMLRQQVSAAKDDETTLKLVTQLSLSGEPAAGKALVEIASDAKASPAVRNRAVELLTANLKGPWSAIITEPQTQDSLKHLLTDPATQTGMLDLIGSQKLREFGEDVLALAQDDKVSDEVRSKALAVLVQVRAGSAAKLVTKLLTSDDPGKQATGIATLVESQDWPALKREIFTKQTDPKLQQQALDAMLATTGGALAALKWIDKNELDASLKERAIAKAVTHPDASVRVMYERFIPADQRQQRLGEAIKAADILALKGNPKRGEQIFYESTAAQCKNCHQVNGKGGTLGPDLSAIGKKYERATLLETILEPSKAISHEFVPYLVQTTDGLVYAGFVVTNDEREVVLKDINSKMVRIRAKDVDVIEPQTKSLMPELVLRDVTAQDAADLLAFMEGLVGAK